MSQTVYSSQELRGLCEKIQQGVGSLLRFLREADKLDAYLHAGDNLNEDEIDTRVQSLLDDAQSHRDELMLRLQELRFQRQIAVRTGRDMNAVIITAADANYGGKTSIKTAALSLLPPTRGNPLAPYWGSPFSVFQAGDNVQLSKTEAADGANDKVLVVDQVVIEADAQTLVASQAVQGMVNTAYDHTAVFTLVVR